MTQNLKTKNLPNSSQPFISHVLELRTRIFRYLIFFLLVSVLCYFKHEQLLRIISSPLGQPLFYSSPAGALDLIIKISLFFGFILTLPFLLFEFIGFISPIFPQASFKKGLIFICCSFLLLLIGITFAFYITLPAALYFLNQFGSTYVQSLITANEYFTFVLRYLLGFGLYFQLPLIIFAIDMVHTLSIKSLFKAERWVILISVILSAIITPTPDIVNLSIMAIPCILLYQISLISLWLAHKQAKKH